MDRRLTTVFWTLRIGLGAMAFLAGCDKFFDILADWPAYLSPLVTAVLPISIASFMHLVGVIEIVVGLAVLGGVTRFGGYVLMAWLLGIAVNLVTTGTFLDVAVRDVEIALAAFALARLTEVGEEARLKVGPAKPAARATAAA